MAIVLIRGYLRLYPEVSYQYYYEEYINDKLRAIDLDEITKDELATRHDAAVRVTFEPEWALLEKDLDNSREDQRNSDAKKIISILSLLPESAIIPKNRLIIYSGIEKIGKRKLYRPADRAFNFLDMINFIDVLEDGKMVRMHPLLREFTLEKIKEDNQQKTLKIESIFNVKKIYYNSFDPLVQEYINRKRDIDSLIEDFKTVLLWSKKLTDDILNIQKIDLDSLNRLYKIIDQESHNLRPTVENQTFEANLDNSILFAQQIHIRSMELNDKDIAEKSRKFLLNSGKPFLNLKWISVSNKEPLIRTLEGHTQEVNSIFITSDGSKIVSGSSSILEKAINVWDLNTGVLLYSLSGKGGINSFAITSDDSKIVSIDQNTDNIIKVWDLNTGSLLKVLKDSIDYVVSSFAITPDNSKIISTIYDRKIHSTFRSVYDQKFHTTIRVWDLNTGELLKTLILHDIKNVRSFAITPDNSKIVSGSYDNTIRVWDLNTGAMLKTLIGHNSEITSIAITTDNSKIVSGSYDNTIRVWDLNSGTLLQTLSINTSGFDPITITPDNSKIVSGSFVSGSYNTTIKVCDLNTGELLKTLTGHQDKVKSIAITPDNSKIVSGGGLSYDFTIRVWDLNTGALLKTLSGHQSTVESIAITPDNSKIVLGSSDNTLKLYDLNTGSLLKTLVGHTDPISSILITPDNSKIVSGGGFTNDEFRNDNTIRVWDLNTGALLKTINVDRDGIDPRAITPDGSKIVSIPTYYALSRSYGNTIKIWDLNTGVLLYTLDHNGTVESIAITPDNSKIVSGAYDARIRVWDLNTGALIRTLVGHKMSVKQIAITSDNSKIVSKGEYDDTTIRVWDLNTGTLLKTLVGHLDSISSIAITPDNSKVVSASYGSYDNTIRVWDLNTGTLLKTLVGHLDSISSIAITPDNSKIVSASYGSYDNTIRVWDLNNFKCILQCKFDTGIKSIELSKDLIMIKDRLYNIYIALFSNQG